MHLAILAYPRSGSHMLESMIDADWKPGCPYIPEENRFGADFGDFDSGAEFYRRTDIPDGLVLSHVKIMTTTEADDGATWAAMYDPLVEAGGKFLIVPRRDTLAAFCSYELVLSHGRGWFNSPPDGHRITVDVDRARSIIGAWTANIAKAISRYGEHSAVIAYEAIAPETARWALDCLGLPGVAVREPTTTVISPPLADYVENFAELRKAFPAPPQYAWQ